MRLILTIPDNQFKRLTSAPERRALEREIGWLLGWARVEEMRSEGKEWRRGDNGHSTPGNGNGKAYLTEAEVEGMTCPLQG